MNNKVLTTLILAVFFTGIFKTSAQNSTNSSEKVKSLIAKKRTYNKHFGYEYQVQIYTGEEQGARSSHSRFKVLFPDIPSKLRFESPNWKVHVGKYKTRLEADRSSLKFKDEFSGVIVVPIKK